MIGGLILVVAAYLAGSIPTGVLLARTAGIDVRREGSGNVGATNVARTAGKKLGVLTLVGDLVKGLVPVVVARALGVPGGVVAAVAFAAIAGHVCSIFLSFRGGKGVATGLGVLLGLAPATVPIALAVFAVAVAATRIVSVASIGAALAAPLVAWWLAYPEPVVLAAAAIAALIISRHRENLVRLLAGTEPRFRARKT